MLSLRSMLLLAGMSLVGAMLAVVAHDIAMSAQLSRLLSRATHAQPARVLVKESAEISEQDAWKRRARRLAQLPDRSAQLDAARSNAPPSVPTNRGAREWVTTRGETTRAR